MAVTNKHGAPRLGGPILEKLATARIFTIKQIGNVFVFTEECDNYFVEHLSREQVIELAKELLSISGKGD